jgi:hypothetical protein
MIEIDRVEVMGWEAAIRGMRNPLNSWGKSDSEWQWHGGEDTLSECLEYEVGPNDLALMQKLADAGPVHGKFLRMITVYMDITAPRYWFTEWDTYKVGTVANSCSTMHKIHAKEFTLDDFSHEHLCELSMQDLERTVKTLNKCRNLFLETKDKKYWWQMIQLLPQSYNQKRTVMLNYEVLRNMYNSRKNHKLDEWCTFCRIMKKSLPYAELFTGEKETE